MKIECNECRKIIKFQILHRKKDELTQFYFICNHCETEYHSWYENNESLALQQKINNKTLEMTKITTPANRVNLFKEIKALRTRKKKILEGINKAIPKTIKQ